tara:strand:- start:43 stop:348 length:306 start_codon:yes stop_codon:yes gene_type:complete
MAINTTLIAVRNPRWHTLKDFKRDENGASVKDESGNHIIVDVLDKNGNTIKVIECETKWTHLGDDTQEWTPFTANPEDTEEHGKALHADLVAGKHGAIADE